MIFLLQVSPQIIEPPIGQSVTEGYPVNLSCVASGVPTPTLVWTFNDGNLPFGINQTGHEGESFLASPSVTKGMNGTYKCKAKNKANTISSSATLRVYGKFSYYDIDHDDDDNEDDDDDDDFDDDDDDSDDDDMMMMMTTMMMMMTTMTLMMKMMMTVMIMMATTYPT